MKPATVNAQPACVDTHLHGPRQAAIRKMHICRPATPAEIEPTDENAAKYLAAIRQRVPAALLPPPGRSPAVIPGARAPNASRIPSTAVGNGPGDRSAVARGNGVAAAAAPTAPRGSPAAALRPASAAAPAEDQAAAAAEAGAFLAGLQNGEGTAALHGTPRDGAGANCCQDAVAFRRLPVVCCLHSWPDLPDGSVRSRSPQVLQCECCQEVVSPSVLPDHTVCRVAQGSPRLRAAAPVAAAMPSSARRAWTCSGRWRWCLTTTGPGMFLSRPAACWSKPPDRLHCG